MWAESAVWQALLKSAVALLTEMAPHQAQALQSDKSSVIEVIEEMLDDGIIGFTRLDTLLEELEPGRFACAQGLFALTNESGLYLKRLMRLQVKESPAGGQAHVELLTPTELGLSDAEALFLLIYPAGGE